MPPTVYVPRPQIAVDGAPADSLTASALSLLVEETTEGLFRCELCCYNYGLRRGGTGYLFFDRGAVEFGKELRVTLGPPELAAPVFTGRISGIEAEYPQEGGGRVVILAEDGLQALRMTRRTRVFTDVSDADLFQQIAGEHGLTPQVDVSGPTYAAVAQLNQSDLAFLRERARCAGAELWVDGTTLHAKARPDRGAGTVDLEYGANLIAFSVRADLAEQCTELGVAGWDVAAKEAIEETADDSVLGAELGGDSSGASVLRASLGERKERLVHTVPLSSAEARTYAQAAFRARARRFVTGSGLADGDPRIRVGAVVNLSDLGGLFDGRYFVVRARHSYDDAEGYRTEFDVERAGLGQAER
jgi:phage protein D